MDATETIKCLACDTEIEVVDGTRHKIDTDRGERNYVSCPKCSLVFQEERPSLSDAKKFYSKEYYDKIKIYPEVVTKAVNALVREFNQVNGFGNIDELKMKFNVLDIGCGRGTRLAELKKYKFIKADGIELSKVAQRACSKQRVNIIGDTVGKTKTKRKYDLIILNHYLSRVGNMKAVVDFIYKHSKPGTKILVIVPYSIYYGPKEYKKLSDGYLNYHTLQSVKALFSESKVLKESIGRSLKVWLRRSS